MPVPNALVLCENARMSTAPGYYQVITQIRQDLEKHESRDDERFDRLDTAVQAVNSQLERFIGGVNLAKWALGIGIPAIFGAIVTHVFRHW